MPKIYARQINPEIQEPSVYRDLEEGFFDDMLIMPGNRTYRSHNTDHPAWRKIAEDFDNMAIVWEEEAFRYHYDGHTLHRTPRKPSITLKELLHDYGFTSPTGKPWSTAERHEWRRIMELFNHDSEDMQVYLPALKLLTGHEWETRTIRGCCQGDWAEIVICSDAWTDEAVKAFEVAYFNTGSEWMIHDEDAEPESPEDISGYCVYCTGWNHDKIREEIAEAAGGKPEDVVLHCWTGEVLEYKYRVV